jgi:two-component system KDP operon response regulator KdpE
VGDRILLFNSPDESAAQLGQKLAECGFAVRVVKSIDDAARLLRETPSATIVVRAGMDGESATIDCCRSLRALSAAPIVVICPEPDEDVVVAGLEAGADDVLATSLSRRGLGARIRAIASRRHTFTAPEVPCHACAAGDLVLDPETHAVTNKGRHMSLTPTEFRLLASLARRAGQVVSHAEILSEVWGARGGESHDIIRTHIRSLRRKLGDAQEQAPLVESRRGIGYRLVGAAS